MNTLQERKRELLLESDLNRQILRLELQQVQVQVDHLRTHWLRGAWWCAAPIAGFFFARQFTRSAGFFQKSSTVFSLATRLWEFWQGYRSRPASA